MFSFVKDCCNDLRVMKWDHCVGKKIVHKMNCLSRGEQLCVVVSFDGRSRRYK